MAYLLYRLNFKTGLHIGPEAGGASLGKSRMTIRSDTLFSALCCTCAKDKRLEELYASVSEDRLAFSDALPFSGAEYFLPKPVLFTGEANIETDRALKKAYKAIEYIPLNIFDEYLSGLRGAPLPPETLKAEFGVSAVNEHVAIKGNEDTQPFSVASFRFTEGCGLYIVVKAEDEQASAAFEDLLISLGISGVGGKQSSGLGKFDVQKIEVPQRLRELLDDTAAEYQMLMGTALPGDGELDTALSQGWYSVIRRGGFIRSDSYSGTQTKKRAIYMLSAGSCLRSRFEGGIYDLSGGGAHPIWRCGKSLFAGFSV